MMRYSDQNTEKREEIGLVDLAAIVVVRRMVAIAVLILTVLAGFAYMLATSSQYQYRSLFQVAQGEGGEPIQSTKYLVSKLETLWLPQLESDYQNNDERFWGISSVSTPVASNLIEIHSVAAKEDDQLILEVHEALIDKLVKEQGEFFTNQQESLREQLQSRDALIENTTGQYSDQSLAAVLELRGDIKRQLDGLRPAEVLATARRSVEPHGLTTWKAIGSFLVAGIVLGIMAAFTAEFFARVRAKLQ